MKKAFFVIIISFLLLSPTFAKPYSLPVAGITPDSIFYSLDILAEKIVLFFTFTAEGKIEKALNYAEERIAEIKVMIEEDKAGFTRKAVLNYEHYLDLTNKGTGELEDEEKKERLSNLIAEKTLNHQEILLEMYQGVSGSAQLEIENTFKTAQEGFEEAIEFLPKGEKEEFRQRQELINSEFQQIKEGEPPEEEEGEEEEGEVEEEPEGEEEIPLFSEEEEAYLEKCKAMEFSGMSEIVRCYKEMGRIFQNLELCKRAGEISGLGSCYGGVAGVTGNFELCNQFEAPSEAAFTILTSTCFGVLAQIQGDPEICEDAPTFKTTVSCYLVVAGLEKNVDICENILLGREGCYIIVASEKKDLAICDKITNADWKNLCLLTLEDEIAGKTELCKRGEALGLFTEEECLQQLLGKQ